MSVNVKKNPIIALRLAVILPALAFLFLITVLAVLAPFLETRLFVDQYESVNSFLGNICHQFPSRCFYVFGSNMGVCARCFSIYLTVFLCSIAFVFRDFELPFAKRLIVGCLLIAPLIIDGLTQYYGYRTSNNFIRCLTGAMCGLSVSVMLVQPYIKIGGNLLNVGFIKVKERRAS